MSSGNQALDNNPPTSAIDINTHGSDFLWAVCGIMLLTDLFVLLWAFRLPRGQRAFHLLPVAILSTASIAYFSMAADLGSTPVVAQFYGVHHQSYAGAPATRAIWYVRYIDWVITTPLLLLELLLATGLPVSDIFAAVFMDVLMIVTGLVGALVASSYKWGYFAFGCAALGYIWFVLFGPARASAAAIGADVQRIYTRSATYLALIWLLYPIAWGLSDGGNVITSDGEMVFYAVLDVLAKPVFILAHLLALRGVDVARFGMGGAGGRAGGGGMGSEEKIALGVPQQQAGVGMGMGLPGAGVMPDGSVRRRTSYGVGA